MTNNRERLADQLRQFEFDAALRGPVATRHALRKWRQIVALAGDDLRHHRLIDLFRAFSGNWLYASLPNQPEAARWEAGWRQVGGYVWAHGFTLAPEQAQKLVSPVGSVSETGVPFAGQPLWGTIDQLIDTLKKAEKAEEAA